MPMQNPFSSSEPVTDPSRFYGRRGDIRRIYARIGAERPQSVSVVGEPLMGKSSLLNILTHPETKHRNLPDPSKSVFGLLHLRDRDDWTPDGFFQALTQALRSEHPDLPEVSDYDRFREVIRHLASEGFSVIAFFDDFDVITQNPNFPLTFFSFMRSMANTYNVAYITTSSQPLQRLCVLKDVEESPFFNIFTTISLKPLKKGEVQQWVVEESSRSGISLGGEAEWVYDEVGGFPLFVRLLCELLLDRKASRGKVGDSDLDEVNAQFQEKVRDRFEAIWSGFSDSERSLCAQLLTSEEISRQQMHVARELIRRGYVVESEKGYRLFGRTFERFVADKIGVDLRERHTGKRRRWWKLW
jgi:serine/threonine-protein kinase